MFGSSQLSATQPFLTQSDAPAKRARQEEKSTCLPVTVRWIESAIQQQRNDGSEELSFHGVVPGMLTMVGVIEELNAQPLSLDFLVNDGTGRLRARYFASEPPPEGFSRIVCGRYVCIVGEIRTTPAVHFGCNTVNVVESADEVSYHAIEVANASLRLQKGMLATPAQGDAAGPVTVATSPPSHAAPVKAPVTAMQASPVQLQSALGGAELRAAILSFLRNEQERVGEQGVAMAALTTHLSSTPAADVRNGIEALVSDGEAYTTMDDDHFSAI